MNSDELRRRAKDNTFISGIHNYCDYWCDRCPLARRCAISPCSLNETRRPADMSVKEALDDVFQRFADTLHLVKQCAAKNGVDVTRGMTPEEIEEEEAHQRLVQSHPLAKAADRYARRVQRWFEAREHVFRAKAEQLESIARMGLEGRDPVAEAKAVSDAVDVILWYQHFIRVKLLRGLEGDDRGDEELHGFPKDSDGSVKIALIAMDRSIDAWAELIKAMAEEQDSILDLLVALRRLREGAEKEFPDARSFIRPGFDEPGNNC